MTFEIPVQQFDRNLLPHDARQIGSQAFRNGIVHFFESQLKGHADWIQVGVDDQNIKVSWRSGLKSGLEDAEERAVQYLRTGNYAKGVQLLRILSRIHPENFVINYNLGMALSDMGLLDEALSHLELASRTNPENANSFVALGVAYIRKGRSKEAKGILQRAVSLDPNNPYALRNLGSCLLSLRESIEHATDLLKISASLLPNDQQAWVGLAQALEQVDDIKGADDAYIRAIALNPHNKIAEVAKAGRSRIAHINMREAVGGGIRPDAVMYILGALQKCEKMEMSQIQKIAIEIGAVGMKGMNPNDANQIYRLRSVPGEFTGLHLLCWMFVTWMRIAPEMSIDFDLTQEYAEAKKMLEAGMR